MKLLVFSDLHGDLRALERLMAMEADYYFAAGDLANWSRGLERCGPLLASRGERVCVLPGNHESAAQIAEFCARFGLTNFHGKTMEAAGRHIAGLGYSNITPFGTPGEYTEEQIAERLEPFAALAPLVLICHCPPLNTALDRVRQGTHAGSSAVRAFIDRVQPEHFVCGHIHEAEGATAMLGRTRGVNAGKRGYLIELS